MTLRIRPGVLLFCLAILSPTFAFAAETPAHPEPNPLMVAPFALLLLAIAIAPFVHGPFWARRYHVISIGLASIVTVYYVFILRNAPRMLASAIDYMGFMAIMGSLFVIASGIHIKMIGHATPATNTGMLALGALLANLIGTTGASMLLIRPFLRINKYRAAPYQVVFFIFIVSNIGGALTPIGDPPLFLGYLKGVPFFWLLTKGRVVLAWLLCIVALLVLFFTIDRIYYARHPTEKRSTTKDVIKLEGSHNFIWLFVIIGLVLAQKAEWLGNLEQWRVLHSLGNSLGWTALKTTESFVAFFVAALMLATAWAAYRFSSKDALRQNEFSFAPVREVGFLFFGIFATMVPALDLLETHASSLGLTSPREYFWASGALSSVLDNAPTYLSFLSAAFGLHHLSVRDPADVQTFLAGASTARYVVAISLGSVYFGAATYIGNGPNFMVKSIAESCGAKCPSFFGYFLKYSVPILLILFILISLFLLT